MIDNTSDIDKLKMVRELVAGMSEEFKQTLAETVAVEAQNREQESTGEQILVDSSDDCVRIRFTRKLSWLVLPKAHALQFAGLLLQHAGATIERRDDGGTGPTGSTSPESA